MLHADGWSRLDAGQPWVAAVFELTDTTIGIRLSDAAPDAMTFVELADISNLDEIADPSEGLMTVQLTLDGGATLDALVGEEMVNGLMDALRTTQSDPADGDADGGGDADGAAARRRRTRVGLLAGGLTVVIVAVVVAIALSGGDDTSPNAAVSPTATGPNGSVLPSNPADPAGGSGQGDGNVTAPSGSPGGSTPGGGSGSSPSGPDASVPSDPGSSAAGSVPAVPPTTARPVPPAAVASVCSAYESIESALGAGRLTDKQAAERFKTVAADAAQTKVAALKSAADGVVAAVVSEDGNRIFDAFAQMTSVCDQAGA